MFKNIFIKHFHFRDLFKTISTSWNVGFAKSNLLSVQMLPSRYKKLVPSFHFYESWLLNNLAGFLKQQLCVNRVLCVFTWKRFNSPFLGNLILVRCQ